MMRTISLDTTPTDKYMWLRIAFCVIVWIILAFVMFGCSCNQSTRDKYDTYDLPKMPKLGGYTHERTSYVQRHNRSTQSHW
jgi:hypothetical protein